MRRNNQVSIGHQLDPIEAHPLFHRLLGRRQTGLVYHLIEGAQHTRYEHSRGVREGARRSAKIVARYAPREFSSTVIRSIELAGLLHDITQSPMSHQTAPLLEATLSDNHEQRAAKVIRQYFSKALRQLGADPQLVIALIDGDGHGKDPRAQLIHDKTIGADFLDWCYRDSIAFNIKGCPDIEKIRRNLVYIDGVLGCSLEAVNDIKAVQKYRYKLHEEGYLTAASLCLQRKFQRAVEGAVCAGDLTYEGIWDMSDAELEVKLLNSSNKLSQELMARIVHGPTRWYVSAVVLHIQGSEKAEKYNSSPVKVKSLSEHHMYMFVQRYSDPRKMTELEDRLSRELKIPSGTLLVAPVAYFSRVDPYDVQMFSPQEWKFHSLFHEIDPSHSQSMLREARDINVIRIAVEKSYHHKAFNQAAIIEDIIKEAVSGSKPY